MSTPAVKGEGLFEANKSFNLAGVSYQPGDVVDVSLLADFKVSQLLNHRILRPARVDPGTTTR